MWRTAVVPSSSEAVADSVIGRLLSARRLSTEADLYQVNLRCTCHLG